jgi:hypothetical protein
MFPQHHNSLLTSNLSPQDAFLISLHEQIVDLQKELQHYRVSGTKESRYYYLSFCTDTPCSIHTFQKMMMEENPTAHMTLLVLRTDPPLDATPLRHRAYFQLSSPHRLLFSPRVKYRAFTSLDSFEFYQAIRQWKPGENGVHVWCSSFSNPENQAMLGDLWTDENLLGLITKDDDEDEGRE